MPHEGPNQSRFDVVIATRDRPRLLAACLASLARQSDPAFGVLVVDDAGREPARVPAGIALLRNDERRGPAASRNRILESGTAPYLLFLDDDVVAHPDLVARHRAVFAERPGPVVSIGSLRPPPGVRLPPWDLWQADRLAREEDRMARGEVMPAWHHLYTGNVAVRREDFAAVGGFDPGLTRQEDMELGRRLGALGCHFAFEPAALVWHDARHSLESWLRLPAANARHDVLMDRRRPETGRLALVERQLRERHPLLRAARRACARPYVAAVAVRLAARAGRALYRLGAERVALLAFSLVWDLEYSRALRAAAMERDTPQPAPPSPR